MMRTALGEDHRADPRAVDDGFSNTRMNAQGDVVFDTVPFSACLALLKRSVVPTIARDAPDPFKAAAVSSVAAAGALGIDDAGVTASRVAVDRMVD
jgi:hypothetical protein